MLIETRMKENYVKRLLYSNALTMMSSLIVILIMSTHAYGLGPWVREPVNPILTKSSNMEWFDSGYIAAPKIVYDTDTSTYFMFYTGGVNATGLNRESIGLATAPSIDGPWTKYDSPNDRNALFAPGPDGSFYYSRNWGSGTVRKNGANSWEMWTVGSSNPGAHVARVGYATSTNGYDWTMYEGSGYGGSIFEDFTINQSGIGAFAVVETDGIYDAWYSLLYEDTVKHATSTNGIDWTIQTDVLGINPVYTVDSVYKSGQTYYLTTSRTGLEGVDIYTSTDKTNWTPLSAVSLEPSEQGWDEARVYEPFLYPMSEHEWYLFYTGASVFEDNAAKIGYAYTSVPEPGTVFLLSAGFLFLSRRAGMVTTVR
jgi:hypothetical protein